MKETYFIINDLIRKTPNKVLIIFFFWLAYGGIYQKYLAIHPYYNFKVKQRENKRKFLFRASCEL